MAVKIRLKRMGSKKRPFYRIIATDSRMPRDGRFIETLGYYNPIPNPEVVHVDEDLIFKWFERGAVPTTSTASILRQAGCLQKWELMKQGIGGDALQTRVDAIKAQRLAARDRREKRKQGAVSAKAAARARAAAEAEGDEAKTTEAATQPNAPAETKTEAPAEAAPEAPAETKTEAPAEAKTEAPAEAAPEKTPADTGGDATDEGGDPEPPADEPKGS
ncbi:MAG: 30S ribosomal protein S16 [Candidatus Krumholzibacteriia bacterium]